MIGRQPRRAGHNLESPPCVAELCVNHRVTVADSDDIVCSKKRIHLAGTLHRV